MSKSIKDAYQSRNGAVALANVDLRKLKREGQTEREGGFEHWWV